MIYFSMIFCILKDNPIGVHGAGAESTPERTFERECVHAVETSFWIFFIELLFRAQFKKVQNEFGIEAVKEVFNQNQRI